MLLLAGKDSKLRVMGNWEGFHFMPAMFLGSVPSVWHWSMLLDMLRETGTCLGVRDGSSQPSTPTSNLHLYLLSRNKKSEPFQLVLYVLTAICFVGFLVTFFFFSPIRSD